MSYHPYHKVRLSFYIHFISGRPPRVIKDSMTCIWHFIRPKLVQVVSCFGFLYYAYCCSSDLNHYLPFYNVSKAYCMRARFMFVFIEYPLYKVHLLCKSLQYKQFLLIITGFTSTNWEKHTRRNQVCTVFVLIRCPGGAL